MRLKVLPLDFWMQDDDMLEDCVGGDRYLPTAVWFGRPGIYLEGDQCWFEVDAARAFLYPKTDFVYQLKLLEVERITVAQAKALREMVRQRLATKAQREMLYMYENAMDIRRTGRDSRKSMLRFLREIREEEEQQA